MGTRTIATLMRINAPGRAFAAAGPVTAGASTPVGALVAGADAGGGVTCTLFSGSSWQFARDSPKERATSSTRINSNQSTLENTSAHRRLPLGPSRRLGFELIPGFQRLKAILARLAKGGLHRRVIDLSKAPSPVLTPQMPICHWDTIEPVRSPLGDSLRCGSGRKSNLFNGEHDQPHGKYLSVSRLALQPFRSQAGRRRYPALR